jgi:hypothetical protein
MFHTSARILTLIGPLSVAVENDVTNKRRGMDPFSYDSNPTTVPPAI